MAETDDDRLLGMAGHHLVRVRVSVAADAAATPDLLTRLSTDSSRSVRRVVAARADTPGPALGALVTDSDRLTRAALAVNPSTPTEALVGLLADPQVSVRLAVVDNPAAADPAVRRAMCGCDDEDVRVVLAQRPGLQAEIVELLLNDPSGEVRRVFAECTDDPTALPILLTDPEARVRAAAATNAHTTADQRRRLVRDPSAEVRAAVVVAKSINGWDLPEEDLLTLAHDRSVNVRYWLANHSGATRAVYQILADDSDDSVARSARAWLLPPDDPGFPGNQTADDGLLDGLLRQGHFGSPEYLGRPVPVLPPEAIDEVERRVLDLADPRDM